MAKSKKQDIVTLRELRMIRKTLNDTLYIDKARETIAIMDLRRALRSSQQRDK